MGVSGVLLVAFIILKLCGIIAWPWVWVLSPLWIGIILVVGWIGLHYLLAKWITK